jgi:hypothetical protein
MSLEKDGSKYEQQLMEVEKVFQAHIKEEESQELPKLLKVGREEADATEAGQAAFVHIT